jgi:hypothetical protein
MDNKKFCFIQFRNMVCCKNIENVEKLIFLKKQNFVFYNELQSICEQGGVTIYSSNKNDNKNFELLLNINENKR